MNLSYQAHMAEVLQAAVEEQPYSMSTQYTHALSLAVSLALSLIH